MHRIHFICLLFILVSQPLAVAGLVLEFGEDDYVVSPNQIVEVDVFLVQDDPTGDPVDLSVDGLISAGISVFFDTTPPSDPATVPDLPSIMPDPAFNDTTLAAELFLDPGVSGIHRRGR